MSEEEKEFKADHFENIEELVKTCKMWVTDDDYDAYCRFFDMGALEEILNYISNLQEENKEIRQWKYVIDTYEDLDKLKELDEIFIKGKKYIAEENLQKELDKKDKVINEVIEEYVKSIITEKQFCPIINDKVKNCARYDVTCDICMKEYFYKKAEDKNE